MPDPTSIPCPNPTVHDPTRALPIDLKGYIEQREHEHFRHLVDGIPDYSFSLDQKLRRQLSAFPPVRWALKGLVRSLEPIYQHVYAMEGVAVGPDQYPQIHAQGEQCARRLGIGVPRIFILFDAMPNAMTLACDDSKPSIIITTPLIRSLNEAELLAIIGHECGHIHNLHGAYNTLVQFLTNPLARGILNTMAGVGLGAGFVRMLAGLLETSTALFLARWSRCAEVTCDRAGVICAGDPIAMVRALAKLQTGGEEVLDNMNIDAYVRQLSSVKATPLRLMELGRSHPLTHKRIEAVRLFAGSDVFRSWCPNHPANSPIRPLAEIDAACEPLIRVWDKRLKGTAMEGGDHG